MLRLDTNDRVRTANFGSILFKSIKFMCIPNSVDVKRKKLVLFMIELRSSKVRTAPI